MQLAAPVWKSQGRGLGSHMPSGVLTGGRSRASKAALSGHSEQGQRPSTWPPLRDLKQGKMEGVLLSTWRQK